MSASPAAPTCGMLLQRMPWRRLRLCGTPIGLSCDGGPAFFFRGFIGRIVSRCSKCWDAKSRAQATAKSSRRLAGILAHWTALNPLRLGIPAHGSIECPITLTWSARFLSIGLYPTNSEIHYYNDLLVEDVI